jgi:hypothetical protein
MIVYGLLKSASREIYAMVTNPEKNDDIFCFS